MGDFGIDLHVINEADDVIDTLSSEQIHKTGKLHRAMHTLVINDKGDIFVRKRSYQMELYPGVWTSSVGEHVFLGESYTDTAKRALREFLGLETPLEFLGKVRVHDKIENELVAVFKTHANAVPDLNTEHSEEGHYLCEDKLNDLLDSGTTTPHLAAALKLYLNVR